MTSALIKDTSDASFQSDVLQANEPVLLDCWATWCGPCKAISPLLEEAAKAYEGRLSIVKINVDDNRAVPAKLGVRGVPTLMLFKAGEVKASKVGAVSRAQLKEFIDAQL